MKPLRRLAAVPDLGTYAGALLLVIGFLVIGIAWHDMARQELVPYQLPYLASGGAVGVGLILCGLTLIAVTVRAKDAAAKKGQLVSLAATLTAVENAVRENRLGQEAALEAMLASTAAIPVAVPAQAGGRRKR